MGLSASAFVIGPDSFENDIRTDRKVIEALTGGFSGVFSNSAFTVSPVSSMHQISIASGIATLAGRSTPASQGSYLVWSDAVDVVNLPAVQASPYIVAVVLRVADPQYGVVSGSVGARYDLVSGTPASSPVAPTDSEISAASGGIPGAWIRLADIRINSGDTGEVPAGQFTDKRGCYFGEPSFMGVEASMPAHKASRRFYDTVLNRELISDGATWRIIGGNVPTAMLRKSTNQSIPDNAATQVTFDTMDSDLLSSASDFTLSGNALYFLRPGIYQVGFQVMFASDADAGQRKAWVTMDNNSWYVVGEEDLKPSGTAIGSALAGSTLLRVENVNSFLKMFVQQVSGGALNIYGPATNVGQATTLWAAWKRPL